MEICDGRPVELWFMNHKQGKMHDEFGVIVWGMPIPSRVCSARQVEEGKSKGRQCPETDDSWTSLYKGSPAIDLVLMKLGKGEGATVQCP